MKTGWLLYDEGDYEANRLFAEHMHQKAEPLGLDTQVALTETLQFPIRVMPDFVVSRQRDYRLSAEFEKAGVPVFNAAQICEICNDKRNTHRFLRSLPQMKTEFTDADHLYNPLGKQYPLVVKPAKGHGGDRVTLVEDKKQLLSALSEILPQLALVQELADETGRDLRVYVLFGRIVSAVLRTAKAGIVSNYKRGGAVKLHTLNTKEEALVQAVIQRFAEQGSPLSFAGVDLLYHRGEPVINEVEDVVGSRMLYKVSDIDVIDLYIREIAKRL